MAKPFKDLRAKLPAAAQKRATTRANVLMQEMPLYELRHLSDKAICRDGFARLEHAYQLRGGWLYGA